MKKNNLPIFGIGPVYVISCLILTLAGLALNHYGLIKLEFPVPKIVVSVIGVILILFGILLWFYAVIVQKIDEAIKEGILVTSGVYSIVRNPIYSAFIIVFTGILIMANNIFLLILPIIFWGVLTILLKQTEEKWLMEKFGGEYVEYCKNVNRVIPWFRKNKTDK